MSAQAPGMFQTTNTTQTHKLIRDSRNEEKKIYILCTLGEQNEPR